MMVNYDEVMYVYEHPFETFGAFLNVLFSRLSTIGAHIGAVVRKHNDGAGQGSYAYLLFYLD